ncbi:MAG: hypothetical protein INR69_17440 [Mucilaginibacter polytrichastri]|nr:hypothetical protein [Mucilaginibacter polytrichastri]
MPDLRPAKRSLPAFDPDNHIGSVDRVRFAMANGLMDQLTELERVQLSRWKQADDWIREKRLPSDRELRNMLMARFSISYDTASRDIQNARELFKASSEDQEYYRSVYIERLEAALRDAERAGDFKAFEKLMRLAAEMRGIDTPKKNDIPYEKLQALTFINQFNPEAIGFKRIENKEAILRKYKEKKRITDIMQKEAEDAELDT